MVDNRLTPVELDRIGFVGFSVLRDAETYAENIDGTIYTQVECKEYHIAEDDTYRDTIFVKGEHQLCPNGVYAVIRSS